MKTNINFDQISLYYSCNNKSFRQIYRENRNTYFTFFWNRGHHVVLKVQ